MSLKEIYETAYAAYDATGEKYLDSIPFYRGWAGLKAVLESLGYADPYKAPLDVHGVVCWSKSPEWQGVLSVLDMHAPKYPDKPRGGFFWKSEPSKPGEKEARAIFDGQYREKFKGKRVNSKHAKELWERVKVSAFAMAESDYQAEYGVYKRALDAFNASEKKEDEEYQEKCRKVDEALVLIAKLKEIENGQKN